MSKAEDKTCPVHVSYLMIIATNIILIEHHILYRSLLEKLMTGLMQRILYTNSNIIIEFHMQEIYTLILSLIFWKIMTCGVTRSSVSFHHSSYLSSSRPFPNALVILFVQSFLF